MSNREVVVILKATNEVIFCRRAEDFEISETQYTIWFDGGMKMDFSKATTKAYIQVDNNC